MLKSARLSFGTLETSPSSLSHPTFRRTGDTPQRDWQITSVLCTPHFTQLWTFWQPCCGRSSGITRRQPRHVRYQRNFLLPPHCSHLIRRSLQQPCLSPRSVQLSILSPLQLSRRSESRTLGSQKPHDIRSSRLSILLRFYHRPYSLL
jgi:hypothetical protein